MLVSTMSKQDASTYQSYLLRLWRDTPHSAWRASLQCTRTQAVQHFATVEACWVYLMAQIAREDDDQGGATANATTCPTRYRETNE